MMPKYFSGATSQKLCGNSQQHVVKLPTSDYISINSPRLESASSTPKLKATVLPLCHEEKTRIYL